jgi:hypothetical protein
VRHLRGHGADHRQPFRLDFRGFEPFPLGDLLAECRGSMGHRVLQVKMRIVKCGQQINHQRKQHQ